MENRPDPEQGAVLIVAIMIMAAVVMYGLSALEYTTTVHAAQNASLDRLKAQSLAEGALDLAYQRLDTQPGFRGTLGPFTEGGATYQVDVRDLGTEIEILATATVGSSKATYTSRANEISSGEASSETVESGRLLHTMIMGGKFSVQQSSTGWTRNLAYGGTIDASDGGSYSGDTVHLPEFQQVSIDPSSFVADRVIVGSADPGAPTVITDLTYDGNVRITGSVDLEGDTNVNGTILVEGNLGITGNGPDRARVIATNGNALLVMGDLKIDKLDAVTVQGSIFCHGEIQVQKTRFDGLGSVYVNEDIKFKQADGSWSFDPGPGSLVPPSVTVEPPTPLAEPVQELWRKPGR